MKKYTIYCTPEQTKKALEFGAPINVLYLREYHYNPNLVKLSEGNNDGLHIETPYALSPTAEQMMGWLRSKGFRFKIIEHESYVYWQYAIGDYFDHDNKPSAKEATLAVIDAALEYLKNPKQ